MQNAELKLRLDTAVIAAVAERADADYRTRAAMFRLLIHYGLAHMPKGWPAKND